MESNQLKKDLRKRAYELSDLGYEKQFLKQELKNELPRLRDILSHSQTRTNQAQHRSETSHEHTPRGQQQHNSGSFFDFLCKYMLLNAIFNRGGNVNVYTNTNNTQQSKNKNDGSIILACVAVFCLMLLAIASIFLLAYSVYKLKNAKLENNKYSVPSAVIGGVIYFCVAATLTLLISGMIVPNLQREMGFDDGRFFVFQIIIGLNAAIFAVGSCALFYLAINKAMKKSSIDKEVDRVLHEDQYSPSPRSFETKNQYNGYQHCDRSNRQTGVPTFHEAGSTTYQPSTSNMQYTETPYPYGVQLHTMAETPNYPSGTSTPAR
jgi:flagellar basal body-associated protein FliL